MTLTFLSKLRRSFVSDLIVVAALAAVVAVEIASLASVADDLSMVPSGLVLDARGDGPAGLSVGEPRCAPLIDDRLARRERVGDQNITTL
jgi:hypothetical protein